MTNMCNITSALAVTLGIWLALPDQAIAQTLTQDITLEERGFSSGFVLRDRQVAEVYISVPRGTRLTGLELDLKGAVTAPTLERGSLLVSVNGRPIDGMRVEPGEGLRSFQRRAQLGGVDLHVGDGNGIVLRLESDLRSSTELCADGYDSANTITIDPATRLSVDLDIADGDSLGTALDLVAPEVSIILPPDGFDHHSLETAMRLGLALEQRGHKARFAQERRPGEVTAFRIAEPEPAGQSGRAVRLNRVAPSRFEILVDGNADLDRLAHQWFSAPGPLLGTTDAAIHDTAHGESAGTEKNDARQIPLQGLPGLLPLTRKSEWVQTFPMLNSTARVPKGVELLVFVPPGWSGERSIAMLFLNDQIIAAARPDSGEIHTISAEFPPSLLRPRNMLKLVLRGPSSSGACGPREDAPVAQVLPGSRLILDRAAQTGFGDFARRVQAASAVRIVLPGEILAAATAPRYLGLAVRLLGALHAGRLPRIEIASSAETGPSAIPEIVVEPAEPDGIGLAWPLTARSSQSTPLAGLFAEDGRLRVVVSEVRHPPVPPAIELGLGSRAVIAASGILWQDEPSADDGTLLRRFLKPLLGLRDWWSAKGLFLGAVVGGLFVTVPAGRRALSSGARLGRSRRR